jgi:septum formation protein
MKVILFSKSPRRQELLTLMGIDFRVVTKDVDESFPAELTPDKVAQYIAEKKAHAFDDDLNDELLITADTIVSIDGEILGKPADEAEANVMLQKLSGRTHQVYTGVALSYKHNITSFVDRTDVDFRSMTNEEIEFYIREYKPYDKAGAYGIQEWIGLVVITAIRGSYTNVMGLPTEKLFARISELAK